MDAAPITRMRWRLRGAWMWPSFVILALADGWILSWRPFLGDSGSPVLGVLLGWIFSLVGVAVLGPPLGWALRRVRMDMPVVVARDYVGAVICVIVTFLFLSAGLIHHPIVVSDQNALQDASATAEAYIGDHAPQRFQADLRSLSTYSLQPPDVYRVCAHATSGTGAALGAAWYCVVVNLTKPFAKSVSPAGSESNSLFSQDSD